MTQKNGEPSEQRRDGGATLSDGQPKLCECGCGEPAPIAKMTNRKWGNVAGQPQRFVLGHVGRVNKRQKCGRKIGTQGYVQVLAETHPRRNRRTGYVLEHLLIAEAALGRPLPRTAIVHHVDENPSNNRSDNLVLCEDQGYHILLHKRLRALRACGNASALRCQICGGYGNQGSIVQRQSNCGRGRFYHIECERSSYQRQRLARQTKKREAAQHTTN